MNIHEHQAKQLLKKYGALVPDGVYAFNVEELIAYLKTLPKNIGGMLSSPFF